MYYFNVPLELAEDGSEGECRHDPPTAAVSYSPGNVVKIYSTFARVKKELVCGQHPRFSEYDRGDQ